MKLAAIAKLIKADGYCKLYKVFYDDCRTYDLYIGTKTAIFPLTGFPKAQNESELATLLGISKKEWADIEFDNDCPDDLHHIEGMDLDDTADGEMDCVTGRISIRYCGCELVPMIEPVSGTVGFVDAKQIMPVADEIRKSGYFKWHDKPEGDPWNVCFDKPLNRSDQPQPVVKLNEKQEAKK